MSTHQHIDISDGGMVAAVLGRHWQLPKAIADHPQLALYDGNASVPPKFPPNLKAIAFADGLNLTRTQYIKTEANKRDVLYVSRGNSAAMTDVLNLWLATAPKGGTLVQNGTATPQTAPSEAIAADADAAPAKGGKKPMAPRGAIPELAKQMITKDNRNEATAVLARTIFDEAKRRGIPTTIMSVEQVVRTVKKTIGASDRPMSLLPPDERERLEVLKTFDDALAGLTLTREWIAKTETKVAELSELKARMQALLGN